MCFDYDTEYDRAYNAAMTIENSTVVASGGKYIYKNKTYSDRVELTAAMNEYVFADNLKTVYYDPNNFSSSMKYPFVFSSQAFDGTVYLDDKFQFVSSHGAETSSVIAKDSEGNEYSLDFFVEIAEQSNKLSHGEYTIVETDMYGNTKEKCHHRYQRCYFTFQICPSDKQKRQKSTNSNCEGTRW